MVTEDTYVTTYLFERLSMAFQKGNAVSFRHTLLTDNTPSQLFTFSYLQCMVPAALSWWAKNNDNNNNITHHIKHRRSPRERLPLSATIHCNSTLQCGRFFGIPSPTQPSRTKCNCSSIFFLVFSLVFSPRDLY